MIAPDDAHRQAPQLAPVGRTRFGIPFAMTCSKERVMATQDRKQATKNQQSAPQDTDQGRGSATEGAGTARDREMGRASEPLGDQGHGQKSWTPPAGEQGISNRPNDAEPDDDTPTTDRAEKEATRGERGGRS